MLLSKETDMGHFYNKFSDHLEHRAKYGTANSTSSEKGTDNKKNNTSQYNHEYYMKNKEKWADNKKEWSKDDKDFDESNYSDENWLKDTDFYVKKKEDGSFVVLLEDTKWTVPAGTNIEDIKKKLQEAAKTEDVRERSKKYDEILKGKSNEKEFDVDAAARDVIRGKYKNGAERKAALGDDYELVQKRVNELMKQQKTKGSSSGETKKESNKGSSTVRSFEEAKKEYIDGKKKKKKKNKSMKQSDFSEYDSIGSIFVKDLF